MGYIKACKVLPQELVALIQNYVDGELVSTEQPAIKPKKED